MPCCSKPVMWITGFWEGQGPAWELQLYSEPVKYYLSSLWRIQFSVSVNDWGHKTKKSYNSSASLKWVLQGYWNALIQFSALKVLLLWHVLSREESGGQVWNQSGLAVLPSHRCQDAVLERHTDEPVCSLFKMKNRCRIFKPGSTTRLLWFWL